VQLIVKKNFLNYCSFNLINYIFKICTQCTIDFATFFSLLYCIVLGFQIQFIDYGNTSIVSCDNLAQVSADSLHAPGYAVEASLHQLSPPSGESWSEGALQAFSDLVLESQCDVEVINKSSQSTYSVDLRIQGTSVAQKLVEGGLSEV